MKLHIKMAVSKQQLNNKKKVKYQECLCLALGLGEVSIPAPCIHVFGNCHFKKDLHKPEITSP